MEPLTGRPTATFEIADYGTMVFELYPKYAPNTVCNFISLANKGFYNGLWFYQIMKRNFIRGGCPFNNGNGNPGYRIKGEFKNNGVDNPITHEMGTLSMVRKNAYNSAGCQFMITTHQIRYLDVDYAAFGRIIEGMDVLKAISKAKVERGGAGRPAKPIHIRSVTIDTKGITYPEPEILPLEGVEQEEREEILAWKRRNRDNPFF